MAVLAGYVWLSAIWSVLCSLWPGAASFAIVAPVTRLGRKALLPGAACAAVFVVFAGVASVRAAHAPDYGSPYGFGGGPYGGSRVVEHFAGPAADAVQGQGLVLITAAPDADNKDWDLLSAVLEAGLQAELERRGFDVTQDDKRESLVGEEGIVHGRTVGGRLVLSGTTAAKPTTNLAGKPLATVDSLTPAERSAYQELDDRRSTTQLTPAEHTHWNQLKAKSVFLWLFYVPGPAHGGP